MHRCHVAVMLALAAAACSPTVGIELSDSKAECTGEKPALGGLWAGALQGHTMELDLTETCTTVSIPPFSSTRVWSVGGAWRWNGITGGSGNRFIDSYLHRQLVLQNDGGLPLRNVRLVLQPSAGGVGLSGRASGSWFAALDSTMALASFAEEPVVLIPRLPRGGSP